MQFLTRHGRNGEWRRSLVPVHNNPSYQSWSSMIQRCTNPNVYSYRYYGAKGVSVCRAWRRSFKTFDADMGHRPSRNHSLDRINPFGNYCRENCRWATVKQQTYNKRRGAPILKCRLCNKRTLGRSWYGRCHSCHEYYRRNGIERPTSSKEIARIKAVKISANTSKPVAAIDPKTGSIVERFKSGAEARAKYGTGMANCLSGRSKSSGGFRWIYL